MEDQTSRDETARRPYTQPTVTVVGTVGDDTSHPSTYHNHDSHRKYDF